MNAFLTVKVLEYDVRNFVDVLDKGYRVMTYLDSSEEDIFKRSKKTRLCRKKSKFQFLRYIGPKGTVNREVYDKLLVSKKAYFDAN